MKVVQFIIAIALVLMIYILLRFICKRLCLWCALKKFAKGHNYILKMPFSCLLPINSNNRFIQIKTNSTVYNIKPFGLLRKHCEIHFWNTQEYSIEWYFSRAGYVGTTPIGQTNNCPHRSLGKADWVAADGVPVLLISPANAPVRLTQTKVNHLVELRAGDKIGDAVFADSDYLFRYIKKQEK